MKAFEIINEIEKHAPLSLMLEFDFSGLNLGDINKDVSNVLVCQNVTFDTLNEAVDNNCQMIISHHPAIFTSEELDTYTQKIVDFAKEHEIILYSAHTNLDACENGINDEICHLLDIEVLEGKNTCYRIGKLKKPEYLVDLKAKVEKVFNDKNIRTIGENDIVETICVSSGAGARDDELCELLHKKNIDLLIGGENKLSVALKMRYYNIGLIEIGHYNSEIICIDIFEKWLKQLNVKIVKSNKDINPYN